MLVSFNQHAPPPTGTTAATDTKLEKRRAKVRSAWISFAGRIVAQILGAAATVGFALIVFDRAPGQTTTTDPVVAQALAANTVAVLPFHTYAATPEHDHIAGAMTDLLVTELATSGALKVTSVTSTLRYQNVAATVPEIGRQLGAAHIVEGSVAVAGGRVRVIAQLIDVATDRHLWAHSYESPLDDPLALERTMAADIARDLRDVLAAPR